MMECPRCRSSSGIVRVPSHNEPVSSVFLLIFGTGLLLIMPALPSRFRCTECVRVFRKYTPAAWLYLAMLGFLIVMMLAI